MRIDDQSVWSFWVTINVTQRKFPRFTVVSLSNTAMKWGLFQLSAAVRRDVAIPLIPRPSVFRSTLALQSDAADLETLSEDHSSPGLPRASPAASRVAVLATPADTYFSHLRLRQYQQ
jgi:hypothetical protein